MYILLEQQQIFFFYITNVYLQDGELVRTGNAVLKAEITSADGSRAAETEIADNKNGTYEVGYTVRSEGEYSFALLLYGQPIRGSPFRLRVVKPSDVPQSPDDVKRRVKSPSGTGGHIRQKAVRLPSSMYSTTKKKENPIEDELIYRVGKTDPYTVPLKPGTMHKRSIVYWLFCMFYPINYELGITYSKFLAATVFTSCQ